MTDRLCRGFVFALSCPNDGAPVRYVNGAASGGTQSSAIVACVECGQEWAVLAFLRPMVAPEVEAKRRAARDRKRAQRARVMA